MTQPIEKCWSEIGVYGDKSCEYLPKYNHCRNCPVYSRAGKAALDRPASDSMLDEWTKNYKLGKERGESGDMPVLIFRLGKELFALDSSYISSVCDVEPVRFVPFRTNSLFRGLVKVEQEIKLCVDVSELLGVERSTPDDNGATSFRRMIGVSTKGADFVFEADEVEEITRISQSVLEEPPISVSGAGYSAAKSVFKRKKASVALLDAEKFVKKIDEILIW